MTQSVHAYSAALLGSPNLPLRIRGGSITLDAGRAPHVAAVVSISRPPAATLTALDPRLSKRVQIGATATYPSFGTVSRTFNLSLRDRSSVLRDGTVRLSLASDESLLSDYAPLVEDRTPLTYQSSLRGVVNYALNKAIPGAALEALPSVDADVTAYWPVTNLLPNPSFENDISGWAAGFGATVLSRVALSSPPAIGGGFGLRWQANAGACTIVAAPSVTTFSVIPGRWYVFSIHAYGAIRNARAGIQWFSSGGAVVVGESFGAASALLGAAFKRYVVVAQAPEGASHANPIFNLPSTATSGDAFIADGAMFHEGIEVVPYFDGNTTDSSTYNYGWTGPVGNSTSTRTPLLDRPVEALVWDAGKTALDFLHPLVQMAGCRLVCDEARRWTLRPKDYAAAGALSIRHGVNLIDGTDIIDRESDWYDAAVTEYTWPDVNGVQQTRREAFALTTPYTRLRTFQKTTPYVGPGFSEYAVRRAQGRGREVTATVVADWAASAEQPITIVLEDAPTQVGAVQALTYDLDTDRMTVTTRTTDTPLGAIDLLVGTIDSLVGTIDAL